jgi:hypothetical protein
MPQFTLETNKMNKSLKEAYPPEFGSVQLVSRIYGLSGPAVGRILEDYKEVIDYAEVVRPGNRYGRRLVNLQSFRRWFDTQRVGCSAQNTLNPGDPVKQEVAA